MESDTIIGVDSDGNVKSWNKDKFDQMEIKNQEQFENGNANVSFFKYFLVCAFIHSELDWNNKSVQTLMLNIFAIKVSILKSDHFSLDIRGCELLTYNVHSVPTVDYEKSAHPNYGHFCKLALFWQFLKKCRYCVFIMLILFSEQ